MPQTSSRARTQPSWYAKGHGLQSWNGLTRSVKAYYSSSQTTLPVSCPLEEINQRYCPREISVAALINHASQARQLSRICHHQQIWRIKAIRLIPARQTLHRIRQTPQSISKQLTRQIHQASHAERKRQQSNNKRSKLEIKGEENVKKQPPRAIEITSESDEEINEESTPTLNQPNIKQEISGDEEHTSAPQDSTKPIESTDQAKYQKQPNHHVEEAETGPKQIASATT